MITLFGKRYRLFRPRSIWIRKVVQVFFFGLIALISVNHTLAESGKGIPLLSSASLHALCPFGGVVTIYQYATAGTFVQKIHESAFILMIIGFLLAILFGPVFCGWVCPLGTIQEWVSRFGRKHFKRRFNHFIPARLDSILRYTRYLVLALGALHDRGHRYADLLGLRSLFCPVQPVEQRGCNRRRHHPGGNPDPFVLCRAPVVQVCLPVWRGTGNHQPVPGISAFDGMPVPAKQMAPARSCAR